jgi:hypothetical protein
MADLKTKNFSGTEDMTTITHSKAYDQEKTCCIKQFILKRTLIGIGIHAWSARIGISGLCKSTN